MGYSIAAKNEMLNHLASLAIWASLHTGDPGSAGISEITGAPYTRQPIGWASASEAAMGQRADVQFLVPAGAVINYVGFWSQQFGGIFWGSGLTPEQSFSVIGRFTLSGSTLDLLLEPLLV